MSKISKEQLRKLLRNEAIRNAIAEGNSIDHSKLFDVESLTVEEYQSIADHAYYWLKNHGQYSTAYASQFDYEVNPIHINGIRGLYAVEVEGEEAAYFNTKKAAITYANSRIGNFFVEDD